MLVKVNNLSFELYRRLDETLIKFVEENKQMDISSFDICNVIISSSIVLTEKTFHVISKLLSESESDKLMDYAILHMKKSSEDLKASLAAHKNAH